MNLTLNQSLQIFQDQLQVKLQKKILIYKQEHL